ncbi:MAG TPA: AI-2E family transporter, partial [Leptolyngbyaceae cyanobacterium M65_K2018_010]|nr:AI-2E family transporter [Leptolyngbyaceae cyanobacterium M65_K2018_010]
ALNPFWVFIAILSGARVGGLLGVVVAVPAAVVIKEALDGLRNGGRTDGGIVLVASETQPLPTTPGPSD